jgi:hypothetical protein
MKLWGKLMSGFLLTMAAAFAVLTVIVPEARLALAATAVLLAAAGFFGVPALVRLFSSFTGDEDVLANGEAATATITSLSPTGWRYNRYYPIVRFGLSVEAGGERYEAEIRQAIDPEMLAKLAPGVRVGVRVDRSDRSRVVIDTRVPVPQAMT